MMKFVVVFACLLAVAYGGGLTSLVGQSHLAAPIKIQSYISPAPIIKTPILIPKIAVQPQIVHTAHPAVVVGHGLGLGGLGGIGGLGLGLNKGLDW